jgi:hypothetical protein
MAHIVNFVNSKRIAFGALALIAAVSTVIPMNTEAHYGVLYLSGFAVVCVGIFWPSE